MLLRALRPDDQDTLWEFLRLAAQENSLADVQKAPLLARYAQGWGREGDFGVVALQNDVALGACWARQFPANEPGFGFLSAQIPEISLAVRPESRGYGVGSALLQALIAAAPTRCVALSLSVRIDNRVPVALYRKSGFEIVAQSETTNRAGGVSVVMRLDFPTICAL